jgi:hypothetical protein
MVCFGGTGVLVSLAKQFPFFVQSVSYNTYCMALEQLVL